MNGLMAASESPCDSGVTSRSLGLTDFSSLWCFLKSPIAWKLSEETAEAGLKSLLYSGFLYPAMLIAARLEYGPGYTKVPMILFYTKVP